MAVSNPVAIRPATRHNGWRGNAAMSQPPPDNAVDPVAALYFIDRRYSLDELKTLCFELGVDYDNLPGEGKRGKARELILHESRRRGLTRLAALLEREHPAAFARELAGTTQPAEPTPARRLEQTLDERQATAVRSAVRAVAVALAGEGERPQWNRVYAALRRAFAINSYRDIPASRFDDAIEFLEDWLAELA